MNDRAQTASFSGYRPEKLDLNPARLQTITASLKEAILAAIADGYHHFLSGMAEGFDCMAANCILELKRELTHIRLVCVLPYAAKRKGNDEYHRILQEADEIIELSPTDKRASYFLRNDYLVEHSSRIICYYDGLSGGTEYTIDYATKQGLSIVNLANNETGNAPIEMLASTMRDELDRSLKNGGTLSIAANSFSMYAYGDLASRLARIDKLNFIFTSPSFTVKSSDKENREFYIPRIARERTLYGSEYEVKLRNEFKQRATAKKCAQWIRRKAQFKSINKGENTNRHMMIEQGGDLSYYFPVNNFTPPELTSHTSIAKVRGGLAKEKAAEFYEIWNKDDNYQDITAEVIERIENCYSENSPEFIYYLTLHHLFAEFVDNINTDILPNEDSGYTKSQIWNKLYNFQKDAARAIISKLEQYNGCILADSVGLGKTFTTLAVIKYYEMRNKNVLVLCPKKLGNNWLTYKANYINNPIHQDRLRYDVLYHTDLSREKGESNGIDLLSYNWGNNDLIVIDESHNFRNGGKLEDDSEEDEKENRYQKLLNKVIRSGVKSKILMLSATPVNNRFNDLKNQLRLAYEGDSSQLDDKLSTKRPIDDIFRMAQTAFNTWSKLPTEERTRQNLLKHLDYDFFELLDAVTIARSRKHIVNHYDTTDIGTFPTRLKPLALTPPLSSLEDSIQYNAIFGYLDKLNLEIYTPSAYIQPSKSAKYSIDGDGLNQFNREQGLKRIMSINLLKRLESSIHSFRLSVGRIHDQIKSTIKLIASFEAGTTPRHGWSIGIDENEEFDPEDDEIITENMQVGKKIKIDLADIDTLSWRLKLEADLQVLKQLLNEIKPITPAYDSKLAQLWDTISNKIKQPINEGNKKLIIFTAFADTANYLYEQLAPRIRQEFGLHSAMVSGSVEGRCTFEQSLGKDLNSVLTCFSPISKDKALLLPNHHEAIDILIATDCISEGQNLQDCDYLINYDIHWNPVRIIQRFGRIDRIGSKNKLIQLVNFWPDMTLDSYIKLKVRVESRMQIVDMSSTGDDNLLSDEEKQELGYRKEQLERLQEEGIDLEDMDEGISIMDLGLNEFRLDLLEYVKTHPHIDKTPTGLHCLIPADKQTQSGIIFILKNRTESLNQSQQNRLHPFYIVYVNNDGKILCNHLAPKEHLDKLRQLCRGQSQVYKELCQAFNKLTDDGSDMESISQLLQDSISSIITVKKDKELEDLLSGNSVDLLAPAITGLDDFELLYFFVIRES